MTQTARLTIERREPSGALQLESFDVPFEPGQSVLDGLRWIRVHTDPTLAFRYSCLNANACKECMMEVDGEVAYACTVAPGAARDAARAVAQQAPRAGPRDRDRPAGGAAGRQAKVKIPPPDAAVRCERDRVSRRPQSDWRCAVRQRSRWRRAGLQRRSCPRRRSAVARAQEGAGAPRCRCVRARPARHRAPRCGQPRRRSG